MAGAMKARSMEIEERNAELETIGFPISRPITLDQKSMTEWATRQPSMPERILSMIGDAIERYQEATGNEVDRISFCPVCRRMVIPPSSFEEGTHDYFFGDCCNEECWDMSPGGREAERAMAVCRAERDAKFRADAQRVNTIFRQCDALANRLYKFYTNQGIAHEIASQLSQQEKVNALRRSNISDLSISKVCGYDLDCRGNMLPNPDPFTSEEEPTVPPISSMPLALYPDEYNFDQSVGAFDHIMDQIIVAENVGK